MNLALDGPGAAATAVASLQRMADLGPRVPLPSHGPIPTDTGAAFAIALRRAQRRVDDHEGAVWWGARRLFAVTLMIWDGIPTEEVEPYLHQRHWLQDAAELLDQTPEDLSAELVEAMLASGSVVLRDGRLRAAAEHAHVAAQPLNMPFPREWPSREQQPQRASKETAEG